MDNPRNLLLAIAVLTLVITACASDRDNTLDRDAFSSADGALDCMNDDTEFSMQGSVPADATGPPTPEEELRMFLSEWRSKYGGEIVLVDETTGSLVVDGREQVVAHATPAPAGGWNVLTTLFCESFRL